MQQRHPQSLPADPAAHHVLRQAWRLRSEGRHDAVVGCLKEALQGSLRHDDAFTALALVLKARSLLLLMDDEGALQALAQVSVDARRFNPKLDAQCELVAGQVLRRRAHRRWKQGDADPVPLRSSIEGFMHARWAAEAGLEERLALIADLNRLYAHGLEAAIAGRCREDNPRLLLSAIPAEARARQLVARGEPPPVAGLTIVADLAIGAGLVPREVARLSDDLAFRGACAQLWSDAPETWAPVLLNAAREQGIAVGHKARAVVLASRCLLGAPAADARLARACLVHLLDCRARLPRDAGVPGLHEQIALLRERWPAAGRRLFR
jgi:hypothetical protein